jgi:hypothetical protein
MLPPDLQDILRAHQVEGRLTVKMSGGLLLLHPKEGELIGTLGLEQGNIVFGERRLGVEKLLCDMALSKGTFSIVHLEMQAAGGRLQAAAAFDFNDGGLAHAQVTAEGIQLRETLVDPKADSWSGLVSGHMVWQAPLATAAQASSGQADLQIRQGRLLGLPVIRELGAAMKVTGLGRGANRDTADLAGTFAGDRLHLTQIDVSTDAMAVHGTGDIFLDGRLDAVVNGGPLEKAEGGMGAVGRALGSVTDQMAHYHLLGTLGSPQVHVVLGPG